MIDRLVSVAPVAIAACLAWGGPVAAEVSPDLSGTTYEMDCEPIGTMLPEFAGFCKADRAKGVSLAYRFDRDVSGQWTVSPPLSGGISGAQALKSTRFNGLECLEAPFVLVCEAPRATELFKNASVDGARIQSRSGLVMLAANVGAIDLMKAGK